MRDSGILISVFAVVCFILSASAAGDPPRAVAVLHEFEGAIGGGNPFYGGPTVVGSAIYGTTFNGGANYYGVLYRHDVAVDALIFADAFESGDTSAWSQSNRSEGAIAGRESLQCAYGRPDNAGRHPHLWAWLQYAGDRTCL